MIDRRIFILRRFQLLDEVLSSSTPDTRSVEENGTENSFVNQNFVNHSHVLRVEKVIPCLMEFLKSITKVRLESEV